jgi:hypothetical protein
MSGTYDDSSDAQSRMLGPVPGAQALRRGPASDGTFSRHDYHHPAAGWRHGVNPKAWQPVVTLFRT